LIAALLLLSLKSTEISSMKKTLLAAALLVGFAGVAQAESSVTLYGIIDTGLGYTNIKPGKGMESHSSFGMINGVQSGSRWGLRGTEDLGDGLKAVFTLESGFNSGNGKHAQDDRLFGRQATVGLASDNWGQLDLGRQTNIASKYFASIDPFGAGFGQSNIGLGIGQANTLRYDNMIMYQTPSFSGFQAGLGYSFNDDDQNKTYGAGGFGTADKTRAITAGVRYVNGPLQVALTYDQLNGRSSVPAARDATPRAYAIGGAYDFEALVLSLAYSHVQDGWFGGGTGFGFNSGGALGGLGGAEGQSAFANDFKANSYMVGLTVPLGAATKLLGSWQMVDPSNDKLTGGDKTMNVFSLGATYDLSKRTNLYAYGSYAKNWGFIDDAKGTSLGVGIRHRF